MNAIIALCHFCDHHGPSTIFCTQAFKYTESSSSSLSAAAAATRKGDHVEIELESKDVIDVLPNKPSIVTAVPSEREASAATPAESSQHGGTKASCKACRVFNKGFHHYISYEKEAVTDSGQPASSRICYISQTMPNDPEVFAVVRKACLRTLHCEIFEDPIYFDDDSNGSVIGYEFNIKDCEGRGFQRSYSLIIIMKDRIYLQHLWSFLSKQMSIIAANIKAEAERKFAKDMREKGLPLFSMLNATPSADNEHPSSPTSSSSATITVCETEFFSAQNTSHRDTIQYVKRSQPREMQQQRGLIELCGDEHIFAKLHMWFTWLLRVSTSRLAEMLVQAPPPEDCLVALERERHLSEFNLDRHGDALDSFLTSEDEVDQNLNAASRAVSNGLGEVIYDKELSQLVIENLRQLIKLIGFEKFHQLAYHTMVGNQVIVRSKYENLVVSIIKRLEELIPVGCCKSVYYSNEYIKSYRCKLLGICDSVTPFDNASDLDLNEYVFIDLVDDSLMEEMMPQPKERSSSRMDENDDNGDDDDDTNSTTMMTTLLDSVIESNKLTIILRTNVPEIQHVPNVLKRIESFLMNENLDESSVYSLIQLTKEEWLNKTKVFYKFVHSPIEKTRESIEKVFKMLKLEPSDELALKFWQAGLSNECKIQIRKS